MSGKAVVLHSGGQDSTVCLLLAIDDYGPENVYPIAFHYSQKHKIELQQMHLICSQLGVQPPKVLRIDALHQLQGGALTDDKIEVASADEHRGLSYHEDHGLPSTVVPGRNVVFLSLAAAYGCNLGIYELWTGGCLADYDGYPDCRPAFYDAMTKALRYAIADTRMRIVTPLVYKTKAETFKIAADLEQLELVRDYTHTCYNGDRSKHDWGRGCGECPACKARAAGWQEFVQNYAHKSFAVSDSNE